MYRKFLGQFTADNYISIYLSIYLGQGDGGGGEGDVPEVPGTVYCRQLSQKGKSFQNDII